MAGWGPFDLSGKNAAVTGGAMGIGFGIAQRFIEAGANVLIADIDDQAAQAAVPKLAGGPGKAAAVRADVSDPRAGGEIVAACGHRWSASPRMMPPKVACSCSPGTWRWSWRPTGSRSTPSLRGASPPRAWPSSLPACR